MMVTFILFFLSDRLMEIGAEPHVNTCYKHFYYFVQEFSLMNDKEFEPLREMTKRICVDIVVQQHKPLQSQQAKHRQLQPAASATPSVIEKSWKGMLLWYVHFQPSFH